MKKLIFITLLPSFLMACGTPPALLEEGLVLSWLILYTLIIFLYLIKLYIDPTLISKKIILAL